MKRGTPLYLWHFSEVVFLGGVWHVNCFKEIHVDLYHIVCTETSDRIPPVLNPAWKGKVCALGNVKSVVKPSVIPKRKRDHELPRRVDNFADFDPLTPDQVRIDQRGFVSEPCGTCVTIGTDQNGEFHTFGISHKCA